MSAAQKILADLRLESQALGFDSFGVTAPVLGPKSAMNLRSFVEAGHHGSMNWMAATLKRRAAPKTLWPDVNSIIVVTMNYGPETNPLEQLDMRQEGTISVYARNRDYHDVMKGRLKTLASKLDALSRRHKSPCDVKVFVDTAPVMEKSLAQRAGLGWQGKHTNLVSQQFGSWLFLGSIFTTLELPETDPETDHCGSCSNCLDICPTNAFPAPYKLDARRCISYLTIEHRDPIPKEFRKAMGNRIYGCDDCLAVCPWNKFARMASQSKLAAPDTPRNTMLSHYLSLDDSAFRHYFSGSPVKRIGRNRFVRNCLIAAGNSNHGELITHVQPLCSDDDWVVRDAAHWALLELNKIVQ